MRRCRMTLRNLMAAVALLAVAIAVPLDLWKRDVIERYRLNSRMIAGRRHWQGVLAVLGTEAAMLGDRRLSEDYRRLADENGRRLSVLRSRLLTRSRWELNAPSEVEFRMRENDLLRRILALRTASRTVRSRPPGGPAPTVLMPGSIGDDG